MEEPRQNLQQDEEATLVVSGEEATLVSPRFDDEEMMVARPVVPLGVEADEAVESPAPRASYARRAFAPRRSWVLATVLVSVLIGGVLGGAGLYFFQRQSDDNEGAAAVAPPQAETADATQQQEAAPAPTAEVTDATRPAAEAQAAVDPADDASADEAQPADSAADDDANDSTPAREPEPVPASVRRGDAAIVAAAAPAAPRKRGKKGEVDEEVERPVRRAARPDAAAPVSRPDADGVREARRVDTILYRPRRAARRERARARRDAASTDRLRRIFEGIPE